MSADETTVPRASFLEISDGDDEGLDRWLRPERLHARWQDAAPVATAPVDGPAAWCARLDELARRRFADGSAVRLIVAEIRRLATRRFADADAPGPGEEERAELDQLLEEMIAQVEDLVDAARLASGR